MSSMLPNMAYIDKMKNAAEDALGAAKGLRDDTEKNVYEALNNKNWGASGSTLSDIARDTYSYEKFAKIFKIIWDAAESPPRNWRKIFKALMLCEYLVKNGCERCVDEIRDRSYQMRQLRDFNYYEMQVDRGQGVREKAKQLVELLADNATIREKREEAKKLRDKLVGHGGGGIGAKFSAYGNSGNQESFSSYSGGSGTGGGGGYSDGGGGYSDGGSGGGSGGGGSNSYSDGGIGSDTSGRYSGYNDSPEPPRSTTEPRSTESMTEVVNDAPLRLKPKAKQVPRIKLKGTASPTASSGGGFLAAEEAAPKKKEGAPVPLAAQPPDLFDAFAEPAPLETPAAASSSSSSFDPRSAAQQPFGDFSAMAAPTVHQPAAAPNFADFGAVPDFGSSSHVAQPQQYNHPSPPSAFDAAPAFAAFASAPPQAPMMMQPQQMMMMPPQQQQQQQQPPPSMMMMMPQQHQQHQQHQQPSYSQPPPASSDFGDFAAGAPAPQSFAPEPAADPMSSLISLDGLSINQNNAKQQGHQQPAAAGGAAPHQNYYSPQHQNASFAGLDGFSTTPMPMASAPPPLGNAGPFAPQQPAYAQQQAPMATMPPHNSMGMGAPAPNMYAQQPQQQQPHYGQPQMHGYPPQQPPPQQNFGGPAGW